MAPVDPPFVPALAGAAPIAKHIVHALVQDVKLRPGDFVYETSLDRAFRAFGLTVEEITSGLDHATAQGWLVFDSAQRIYTLTQAGLANA